MNVELKRYKSSFQHSYTLGVFPTIELLENKLPRVLGVILHTDGAENTGVKKIKTICRDQDLEIIHSDRLVNKLSRRGNTYAVGVFEKYHTPLDFQDNHLVLVQPAGMGNLGTIIRAMLGFGHRNLALIEPAADLFHPKVIRASMGALFKINFDWFDQFADYWGTFSDHQLYPLMTDGEMPLAQAGFQKPYTLVLGNEASGLPEEFHHYGTSLRIPQESAVDSLNIALAAGITLYQAYSSDPPPE